MKGEVMNGKEGEVMYVKSDLSSPVLDNYIL